MRYFVILYVDNCRRGITSIILHDERDTTQLCLSVLGLLRSTVRDYLLPSRPTLLRSGTLFTRYGLTSEHSLRGSCLAVVLIPLLEGYLKNVGAVRCFVFRVDGSADTRMVGNAHVC